MSDDWSPAAEMTVAELDEYCHWNRTLLPVSIYLPSQGPGASSEIHFGSAQRTVNQFIDHVESQTGLKASIGGCGNAYTILRGNADNFGLRFLSGANPAFRW